jgi:hypothetical protein
MLQSGMKYYVEENLHVVELETSDEMDVLFDPFDVNDMEMPSHLYRMGHRYIKETVYDWLMANVGRDGVISGGAWETTIAGLRRKRFHFTDKPAAMLFKLRWMNGV